MMGRLFELIKKNFKLLVRARVSALVIFIGPLLLVSLLGLAYSQSNSYVLSASVYSESYSDLSQSLITKMSNQNFEVAKLDTLDGCIGAVKRGESQACVVFPPRMSTENSSNLVFYVDYSQVNLVWIMLDVMSARVSERSTEISKEKAGDLLDRLWFIEEKINESQSEISVAESALASAKANNSGQKESFGRLDISVDFSGMNISDTRLVMENVSRALTSINSRMTMFMSEARSSLQNIEASAEQALAIENDSTITTELHSISNSADLLEKKLSNLTVAQFSDMDNATRQFNSIKAALDNMDTFLASTKDRISSVKASRDRLLPAFDGISAELDEATLQLNNLKGTLAEASEKIAEVKGRSAESISAPITTTIEPISVQKTHFNSLFPILLMLIVMITGILLSSTLIIVEKKSKAYLRNSLSPTSSVLFNLSTYISALVVIFIQLLLFVSISAFFFETELLASIWVLMLLLFLASSVFVFIGMLIGILFRTEETVTLAAITLASVFLLFSSAVIPLESLPAYLKSIASFNPFVVAETGFRQALIFHLGFMKLLGPMIKLFAYALGIFLLITLFQSVFSQIDLHRFYRMHTGKVNKKANVAVAKPEDKSDINALAVKRE